MQSLVGGMSGIWNYVVHLSNSPLDEREDTPFDARTKIRLELRGSQYKQIISNLGNWSMFINYVVEATDFGCILKANMYLNGVAIPIDSSLYSINGYMVLSNILVDLFVMSRL